MMGNFKLNEKQILEYRNNGQLKFKGNHKDGEEDGLWEYYFKNGQLKEKGNFKDGEKCNI